MTEKPISYNIFILVITITALLLFITALFSYYQVDKKYSMILAIIMFVALSFTTVGIYTGYNHRTDEKKSITKNRIGLIGNLMIFLITIGMMIFAAFTEAK